MEIATIIILTAVAGGAGVIGYTAGAQQEREKWQEKIAKYLRHKSPRDKADFYRRTGTR